MVSYILQLDDCETVTNETLFIIFYWVGDNKGFLKNDQQNACFLKVMSFDLQIQVDSLPRGTLPVPG